MLEMSWWTLVSFLVDWNDVAMDSLFPPEFSFAEQKALRGVCVCVGGDNLVSPDWNVATGEKVLLSGSLFMNNNYKDVFNFRAVKLHL